MARKKVAALHALLILSFALSGCISENNKSNYSSDDSSPGVPEYFEDGIFTCLDHDNMTRCWQTHIPENLDQTTSVPLIVDMHGFGSDSTEQKHMSAFDTIADEEVS